MSKGEIHTIDSKLEVTGNQMFVSERNSNEKNYHLDKEIWNAFKGGSLTAYKLIYEKHIDLLFNYGNKITQHSELVEDCMQDLFVDLWIKKSKFGIVLNIKAYLFISFRRRLLDGLNKRKKRIGKSNILILKLYSKGLKIQVSRFVFLMHGKKPQILKKVSNFPTQYMGLYSRDL